MADATSSMPARAATAKPVGMSGVMRCHPPRGGEMPAHTMVLTAAGRPIVTAPAAAGLSESVVVATDASAASTRA